MNTSPLYSFSDDSGDDPCPDDTLLKTIAENLEGLQKVGDDVHPEIAAIINKRWFTTLSKQVLDQKLDIYVKPKNCDNVKVPLINAELWDNLPQRAKRNDNSWLKTQRVVLAATAAVTESIDNIYKASQKEDEIFRSYN